MTDQQNTDPTRNNEDEPIDAAPATTKSGGGLQAAFDKAEAQLGAATDEKAPRRETPEAEDQASRELKAKADAKAKAKSTPKAEPKHKPDPLDEKPGTRQKAPPAAADDEPDEEADEEAEAARKAKEPRKAKAYWSKERREAFAYQPRHVQDAWLEEAPVPHAHWTDDEKAQFSTMDRAGQEIVLTRAGEIERGFQQKFSALAEERKLATEIRAAVPPELRAEMEKRGLNEPAVFGRLMKEQARSMSDPLGYVEQFIVRNRLDPRQLLARLTGIANGSAPQGEAPGHQADVRSHPEFKALEQQVGELQSIVKGDLQQRKEGRQKEVDAEIDGLLSQRDEEGNSLFPFARVLSEPMAKIIEADPERFSSMAPAQMFAEAYKIASEQYPELQPPAPPAKPLETHDDEDEPAAKAERAEQSARLKAATTIKSKTHNTAAGAKASGTPMERAFAKAERRLGVRG